MNEKKYKIIKYIVIVSFIFIILFTIIIRTNRKHYEKWELPYYRPLFLNDEQVEFKPLENDAIFIGFELINVLMIFLLFFQKANKQILVMLFLYIIIAFFIPVYNDYKMTEDWWASSKNYVPGGLNIQTWEIQEKNIYGITIKSDSYHT